MQYLKNFLNNYPTEVSDNENKDSLANIYFRPWKKTNKIFELKQINSFEEWVSYAKSLFTIGINGLVLLYKSPGDLCSAEVILGVRSFDASGFGGSCSSIPISILQPWISNIIEVTEIKKILCKIEKKHNPSITDENQCQGLFKYYQECFDPVFQFTRELFEELFGYHETHEGYQKEFHEELKSRYKDILSNKRKYFDVYSLYKNYLFYLIDNDESEDEKKRNEKKNLVKELFSILTNVKYSTELEYSNFTARNIFMTKGFLEIIDKPGFNVYQAEFHIGMILHVFDEELIKKIKDQVNFSPEYEEKTLTYIKLTSLINYFKENKVFTHYSLLPLITLAKRMNFERTDCMNNWF